MLIPCNNLNVMILLLPPLNKPVTQTNMAQRESEQLTHLTHHTLTHYTLTHHTLTTHLTHLTYHTLTQYTLHSSRTSHTRSLHTSLLTCMLSIKNPMAPTPDESMVRAREEYTFFRCCFVALFLQNHKKQRTCSYMSGRRLFVERTFRLQQTNCWW